MLLLQWSALRLWRVHYRGICCIRSSLGSAAPASTQTHLKRCAPPIAQDSSARQSRMITGKRRFPASFIHSLRWHPVRLISFLDRPYYYGAKKKYLDWIASRHLATGRYDLFHSWSGDCLRSLKVAKQRGIPSIVEIPTWHRDGGKEKVVRPKMPAPPEHGSSFEKWKNRLLLQRKRFIREYELADLLLILSEKAAEDVSCARVSRGKALLSAARGGGGALQAGCASGKISRRVCGRIDQAKRNSTCSRSMAPPQSARCRAMANRVCA